MKDKRKFKVINFNSEEKEKNEGLNKKRKGSSQTYDNPSSNIVTTKKGGNNSVFYDDLATASLNAEDKNAVNSYKNEVTSFEVMSLLNQLAEASEAPNKINEIFEEHPELLTSLSSAGSNNDLSKIKELDEELGTNLAQGFAEINPSLASKIKEWFYALLAFVKDPSNKEKKEHLKTVTTEIKEMIIEVIEEGKVTRGHQSATSFETEDISQDRVSLMEKTINRKVSAPAVLETSATSKVILNDRRATSLTFQPTVDIENTISAQLPISTASKEENIKPPFVSPISPPSTPEDALPLTPANSQETILPQNLSPKVSPPPPPAPPPPPLQAPLASPPPLLPIGAEVQVPKPGRGDLLAAIREGIALKPTGRGKEIQKDAAQQENSQRDERNQDAYQSPLSSPTDTTEQSANSKTKSAAIEARKQKKEQQGAIVGEIRARNLGNKDDTAEQEAEKRGKDPRILAAIEKYKKEKEKEQKAQEKQSKWEVGKIAEQPEQPADYKKKMYDELTQRFQKNKELNPEKVKKSDEEAEERSKIVAKEGKKIDEQKAVRRATEQAAGKSGEKQAITLLPAGVEVMDLSELLKNSKLKEKGLINRNASSEASNIGSPSNSPNSPKEDSKRGLNKT